MIELDIVSHDMFDLPPLSEYELYVKKFGADDTRQVSIQGVQDSDRMNSKPGIQFDNNIHFEH